MHAAVYGIFAVGFSLLGWSQTGPNDTVVLALTAVAIAVIGVPHGGLDHWCGRRWLEPRFSNRWPLVFFGGYVSVMAITAFGWLVAPVGTCLLFFGVSAWHFGREDQMRANRAGSTSSSSAWGVAGEHLTALATGGLVIWVPAVARPDEMHAILETLLGASGTSPAESIVQITRTFACGLLPLGALLILSSLRGVDRSLAWAQMATLLLALAAPILWSFPIYFCGWHSVRGLQRLRQEEALSAVAFALAVLPLSVGGLLVMMAVGWLSQFYFHGSLSLETLADNAARPMVLRSLFVGLSAIAVPHLLLHEVASWTRKRMPLSSQLAIGVDA